MMENVTVNCSELIKKLERNRTKHIAAYEVARAGHKVKQLKALRKAIAAVLSGKSLRHGVLLAKPESHEDDYDRVIGMLRMNRTDKVVLAADDYDRYVRDKWGWSQAFHTSNAAYGSAGRSTRKKGR